MAFPLPTPVPLNLMAESKEMGTDISHTHTLEQGSMAETVKSKQVLLKNYIDGPPKESDFEINYTTVSLNVPEGAGNGVVLRNLYLSCDAYLCFLMQGPRSTRGDTFPGWPLGSAIKGFGVSEVVDSRNPKFSKGDLVWGETLWQEYTYLPEQRFLVKIEHKDVPLSYYTGLFGMSGLSAYAGFFEVCKPKKGDTVFISAASGAVGQLVGQFAKLTGCYVVGSAGSKEKVDILINELGFDGAFNYKEEKDLGAALKRYFPDGIDIDFENVGGKTLDAVLPLMKMHGRISVCGMISQYNLSVRDTMENVSFVLYKRLSMQGWQVLDYMHLYSEFIEFVLPHVRENRIKYVEDIVDLDRSPEAFAGIYSGRNVGKQVIKVARD